MSTKSARLQIRFMPRVSPHVRAEIIGKHQCLVDGRNSQKDRGVVAKTEDDPLQVIIALIEHNEVEEVTIL